MKGFLCFIQIPRISFECGLRRNAFAEIQTLELNLLLIAGLVLLASQYICENLSDVVEYIRIPNL